MQSYSAQPDRARSSRGDWTSTTEQRTYDLGCVSLSVGQWAAVQLRLVDVSCELLGRVARGCCPTRCTALLLRAVLSGTVPCGVTDTALTDGDTDTTPQPHHTVPCSAPHCCHLQPATSPHYTHHPAKQPAGPACLKLSSVRAPLVVVVAVVAVDSLSLPFPPPPMTNLTGFGLSAAINGAVALVVLSLFLLARKRIGNRFVYAPRTLLPQFRQGRPVPPPLPPTYLSWLWQVWAISRDDFVAYAGLDAYMFCRFCMLCVQLFAAMTILGVGILVPVNYTSARTPTDTHRAELLTRLHSSTASLTCPLSVSVSVLQW